MSPRERSLREAAIRATAFLSSTPATVNVDVVVAMLVYGEVAEEDYVEQRALRRLRLLPDTATETYGLALGSEHPALVPGAALVSSMQAPDPTFSLDDDRDQSCPISSLACERSFACDEYSDLPLWGYALTHQALQLVFGHWANCALEPETERISRIAGRLVAEAVAHSGPSDLQSERLAMLGQLGHGDAIDDAWIDALLASQQADGSFLWQEGGDPHPHPTGMALWAFAGWLRALN